MSQQNNDYTVRIETLSAEDKNNPFKIADALENSLIMHQRKTLIRGQMPLLLVGVAGLILQATPLGIAICLGASAGLLGMAIHDRQRKLPALKAAFNSAALNIDEAKPQATLKKISDVFNEDRHTAKSWAQELNPLKHPLRTPAVLGLVAWSLVSPPSLMLAAFVLSASLMDQQSDYVTKLRKEATDARQKLMPWRTGLRF